MRKTKGCWFGPLCFLFAAAALASGETRMHPSNLPEIWRSSAESRACIFVIACPLVSPAKMIESLKLPAEDQSMPLDFIHAAAVCARRRDFIPLLSANAESIEEFTPAEFQQDLRIVRAIEYSVRNGASIVNLSLSIQSSAFDPDDPVNLATHQAVREGRSVVVAAGNLGPDDTLSGWCSPWVICVGAAFADGSRVWEHSSRGKRGSKWVPTVVAPGVDVVTTHPANVPKSDDELEAEKRVGFDKRVPKDKQNLYTVVTGTSFAVPHVVSIIALLLHYSSAEIALGHSTVEIKYRDPVRETSEVKCKPGEVRSCTNAGYRVVEYDANFDPSTLRRILVDLAQPCSNCTEVSAGAGFVSWDMAFKYFGGHGNPDIDLMPLKVVGED